MLYYELLLNCSSLHDVICYTEVYSTTQIFLCYTELCNAIVQILSNCLVIQSYTVLYREYPLVTYRDLVLKDMWWFV